jgi:predicted phage terminase large subunit-like protein
MNKNNRALLNAALRHNLVAFLQRCFQTVSPGAPFLPNWHIEAIAYQLERVLRGEIRRLIITLPPRSLKSISVSVAFPAFVLGHDPTARIIGVSYSQDLSAKHARDCRRVLESGWYGQVFPQTRIDPRKNSEAEFETTAHGFRLATSVGGTLTGRGGNLIIIDDPLKPAEAMSDLRRLAANEWSDTTLPSRLDHKKQDAIVVIMQRLHVDDLVGHLLSSNSGWVHLNLPAIAEAPQTIDLGHSLYHRAIGDVLHPEREPLSILMELKAQMGSQAFAAQYQQDPVVPGGAIIKRDWFRRRYQEAPRREPNDQLVQSWDTASKASKLNDFSVCTTWLVRGADYFLLDVYRERLEYPDLRRQIIGHAQAWNADAILIEDASSGTHLAQDLIDEGKIRPIAIRPDGDKIVRLEARSAVIEAGHVLLPERAAWLDDFFLELLRFPHGRYDDQVDSLSQFLTWVRTGHYRPQIAFI